MDEAEIRAEIERRRKKAADLKLRETLWKLYSSHFKYIDKYIKEEPETVLPLIKESLKRFGNTSEFRFEDVDYRLRLIEGKREKDGGGHDETETTPMTIDLYVNGQRVFEFEMTQSITYGRDMPYFNESMRNVTAFVEGPWIEQITKLLADMESFRREAWKKKNAPRVKQKLAEDMERFGMQ